MVGMSQAADRLRAPVLEQPARLGPGRERWTRCSTRCAWRRATPCSPAPTQERDAEVRDARRPPQPVHRDRGRLRRHRHGPAAAGARRRPRRPLRRRTWRPRTRCSRRWRSPTTSRAGRRPTRARSRRSAPRWSPTSRGCARSSGRRPRRPPRRSPRRPSLGRTDHAGARSSSASPSRVALGLVRGPRRHPGHPPGAGRRRAGSPTGDLTRTSGLTTRDELGRMGQALDAAVANLRDGAGRGGRVGGRGGGVVGGAVGVVGADLGVGGGDLGAVRCRVDGR